MKKVYHKIQITVVKSDLVDVLTASNEIYGESGLDNTGKDVWD